MNLEGLKEDIRKKGYRQRTFAAAMGMSKTTLNSKLNGTSRITLEEAAKMIRLLEIQEDEKKVRLFLE